MKNCAKLFSILLIPIYFIHCGNNKTETSIPLKKSSKKIIKKTIERKVDSSFFEKNYVKSGLINLQSEVPEVKIDLRYTSTNNFMQRDLYGELNAVYVHPIMAKKIKKAIEVLKSEDSSLTLLIFDGVRPLSIQRQMWNEVNLPAWKKGKFLSNPNYGSLHNYGMAVDVSLCTVSGQELDMGTPYDDTSRLAYPELEIIMLNEKKLTKEQYNNRIKLRRIMAVAGFFGIQTEWWHFNACTRDFAKANYLIIE